MTGAAAAPATLFDKLWDVHVVRELDEGWSLLHIDRHLLHDLSGPPAMAGVRDRGLDVRAPATVFATPDHLVSSDPGRTGDPDDLGAAMWAALRRDTEHSGIRRLEIGSGTQGIVHVTGPEQGIVLPGISVICGDSHTCTNGAVGALAFGVGTSQSTQALATSVLAQPRPVQMRIRLDGRLADGVSAKDVALALIGRLGASAGAGFAIEYAGPVVDAMDMEGRFTLCNLTVELGAKFGVIAPDARTFEWLEGRPFAPDGDEWDRAVEDWKGLHSDPGATFARTEAFDVTTWGPTVTWGTSPEHAIPIDGVVPDPASAADDLQADAWRSAQEYMGLEPRPAHRRDPGRPGVHRLVRELPAVGPAGGRGRRRRPAGRARGHRLGGARLRAGSRRRRGRGSRPRVHGGRIPMAGARMQHVRGRQRRPCRARGPLRVDLQPQLRRPPGTRGPHPPRQPSDGGRRGGDRSHQ